MDASPGLAPASPASALRPFLTAQIDAAFPSLGPSPWPLMVTAEQASLRVRQIWISELYHLLALRSYYHLLDQPLTSSTTY